MSSQTRGPLTRGCWASAGANARRALAAAAPRAALRDTVISARFLQRGALRAALQPGGGARPAIEREAEHRTQHEPARSGNVDERKAPDQVLPVVEAILEPFEDAIELRLVVRCSGFAPVFGLVGDRTIHAVVEVLHHVRPQLGHGPDGPAERVGPVLAARGGPQLFLYAVLVSEVYQDRERLEEALLAVDERRHLAVRVQRDELRSQVLLLLRVDLHVGVGHAQLLECPGDARARASRPGMEFECHEILPCCELS